MPDDHLASALTAIRERYATLDDPCGDFAVVIGRYKHCADDVPHLLAAVEAVLKLTVRWKNFTASGEECARELRAAITRELTGTQLGEDEEHG